jgi:hypothetical protein
LLLFKKIFAAKATTGVAKANTSAKKLGYLIFPHFC